MRAFYRSNHRLIDLMPLLPLGFSLLAAPTSFPVQTARPLVFSPLSESSPPGRAFCFNRVDPRDLAWFFTETDKIKTFPMPGNPEPEEENCGIQQKNEHYFTTYIAGSLITGFGAFPKAPLSIQDQTYIYLDNIYLTEDSYSLFIEIAPSPNQYTALEFYRPDTKKDSAAAIGFARLYLERAAQQQGKPAPDFGNYADLDWSEFELNPAGVKCNQG